MTLKENIEKAMAWDREKVLTTRDAYLHPDNCPSEGWTHRSSYEAGARDQHHALTSKWKPIIEEMAEFVIGVRCETSTGTSESGVLVYIEHHSNCQKCALLAKLHKMLEEENEMV